MELVGHDALNRCASARSSLLARHQLGDIVAVATGMPRVGETHQYPKYPIFEINGVLWVRYFVQPSTLAPTVY
jgi:hypothetical protein